MGSTQRLVHCTLNVLITRASDLPGQWIAHCLELDVVTQGNSPSHAIEMAAEAVGMVIEDDWAAHRDPLHSRSQAPAEDWQRFVEVMRGCEPVALDELPEPKRIGAMVVEMNVYRPLHPAMSVSEDAPLLEPHVARAEFRDTPSFAS